MVEQYNSIVAKQNKTKCEMKAVQGDMTTHLLTGRKTGIERPDGVFAGFDLVAMCVSYPTVPDNIDETRLMTCSLQSTSSPTKMPMKTRSTRNS